MGHILIVDDDEIIAELASEILISEGHACGWVTDAAQAEKLLRWRRPDLMLLDDNMPGETGNTLLRRLRKSPQFYDLPVIMFTASTGENDERRARFNGAQDYVRKPVDPKVLLWRVEKALKSRGHRKHRRLEDLAEFQLQHYCEEKPRQVFI